MAFLCNKDSRLRHQIAHIICRKRADYGDTVSDWAYEAACEIDLMIDQEVSRNVDEWRRHSEAMDARFACGLAEVSIYELELTTRALNCLHNQGVRNLTQIDAAPDEYLLSFPNLGRGTLRHIREAANSARTDWQRGVRTVQ